MKKLGLLFFFIFSFHISFACQCPNEWASTNNRYITSDYVGEVEITKVFPSESKTDKYYQAKIKAVHTFKGKIPQYLKIYGNYGFKHGIILGCTTGVEKGETWLIYAIKDSTGNYKFSSCTFPQRIRNANGSKVKLSKKERRDLKQLTFLSQHVPNLNREDMINEDSNKFQDYLDQFKDEHFDVPSAQYLVTFNKNMNIEKVEILMGFSDSFNKDFTHFLKTKTKWYAGNMGIIKKARKYNLKKSTQQVIGIYYYEEGGKSFLSAIDLP